MEMIEDIFVKGIAQVLSQGLSHFCKLSVEAIRQVFGKSPEDMTQAELDELTDRNIEDITDISAV